LEGPALTPMVVRVMRWPRPRWIAAALAGVILLSAGVAQGRHFLRDEAYGSVALVCRVSTSEKLVALTFDDGPDPTYTPTVLRLLDQADAKATFFLIGQHAQAHPALVRDEVAAGMQVGDHTWSHPHLTALSTTAATSEIEQGRAALEAAGAGAIQLFRAPYGLITPQELTVVEGQGLTPVHWSLALDHWTNWADSSAAARSVADEVRPGDIVLAHDARDGDIDRVSTMRIVQALLPLLQQRGYELVTVSELLAAGKHVDATPSPWFWQEGFTCPDG
jgi:peptidoglycan/xylan/chitin deacetylase (PgdA/CDA1 family)